jgi:hypothetical protein
MPPPPPRRGHQGVTFELSLGLGVTHVAVDDLESKSFTGLSGLNIGLGGWITPTTALSFRIAGTSFVRDIGGVDVQFISGFVGPSAQVLVSREVWVGAGVGLGILTTDQDDIEPERGFAVDLRVGAFLVQTRKNALQLSAEVAPGFYDGGRVTSIGFQLGWQRL